MRVAQAARALCHSPLTFGLPCSPNIRMQINQCSSLPHQAVFGHPVPTQLHRRGKQLGRDGESFPWPSPNKRMARTASELNAQRPHELKPAEATNHLKPRRPAHPAGRHWSSAGCQQRCQTSVKDLRLPGMNSNCLADQGEEWC